MLAIKSLLIVLAISFTLPAHSLDENWGILRIRGKVEDHHYSFKYVKRDLIEPEYTGFFNWYELNYGRKLGTYLLEAGIGFLDFDKKVDELRFTQNIYRNLKSEYGSFNLRLGLEERSFKNDEHLYFRTRIRAIYIYPVYKYFNPSIYDEFFAVFNGYDKFYTGLNENRLGLGFNMKPLDQLSLSFYWTFAGFKSYTETIKYSNWLQSFIVWKF